MEILICLIALVVLLFALCDMSDSAAKRREKRK